VVVTDEVIERAWQAGRAAHPGVALERAAFVEFVRGLGDEWWQANDPDRGVDLFLTCACLHRVPRAAERFVAAYIDTAPAYLHGRVRSPDLLAEVRQRLASFLVVGKGEKPPLLASYRGRGTLMAYVRVIAGRVAVDVLREVGRQPRSLETVIEKDVEGDDVELAMLKEAYREPFRQSFGAAIAALSRDHRALLRMHYVEGLTTEQLARMHDVARATIIRRLAAARDEVIRGLQRILRERLGIDERECKGLLRDVRSQLDLSLARLLRDTSA
jgi:RNA polymerase sigma-70 factor, ECF subfamily